MLKGKKILLAVGMAMAALLGGSAVQAAPTDEAKDQFCKETLALVDYDEGQLAMEADLKSMVSCHYESNLYFSMKPHMKGKGTVKMMFAVPNQPAAVESEYYLQENDKEMVVYFRNPDNSWSKSTVEVPAGQKNLYKEGNREMLLASLDTVKAVELGAAEGDRQRYVVTVDGKKILPYFTKMMNMAGEPQTDVVPMLKPVFDNMGDFTYTVEIDRARHMVTGMQADLTEPMRRAAMAACDTEKCTPEQVQQVKDIVNASTLTITIKAMPFAKVPDLSVPQKVVREAKEIQVERMKGNAAVPNAA